MSSEGIQRRYATTRMDGATLQGVAVPYNSRSGELRDLNTGPYHEMFERGAFGKIPDSVALYVGHDPQQIPIARVGSGTLRFSETRDGLMFEADISGSRPELIDALTRGDLPGASVGFRMKQDKWITNSTPPVRMVRTAELVELSLVVNPAYPDATLTGVASNG